MKRLIDSRREPIFPPGAAYRAVILIAVLTAIFYFTHGLNAAVRSTVTPWIADAVEAVGFVVDRSSWCTNRPPPPTLRAAVAKCIASGEADACRRYRAAKAHFPFCR